MITIKPSSLAIFMIITGIGIGLFWVGFFTIGLAPQNPPPGYFVFEHSFPVADTVLAIALLCSGILLRRNRPAGRDLALASCGALIFLGLLDTSFNLLNGMYTISAIDTLLNGFINAYCIIFGAWAFIVLKNHRIQNELSRSPAENSGTPDRLQGIKT